MQYKKRDVLHTAPPLKKTLNSSSLNLSNSKTTPSESVDRYKHKSLIHKNSLGQSKGSQLDLVYLKPRATVRKKSAREIIFKILFLKYTSNLGVITWTGKKWLKLAKIIEILRVLGGLRKDEFWVLLFRKVNFRGVLKLRTWNSFFWILNAFIHFLSIKIRFLYC